MISKEGQQATYQPDRSGWPVEPACNGTEETQRVVHDGMGIRLLEAVTTQVLALQARVEVGRDEVLCKGGIPDAGDESEARGCVHW
jgi:hypothetical protein